MITLHTARTATTGGREHGASRSSDGLLDIVLSSPGSGRIGANPEQLFAAAWSASLGSAIMLAAVQQTIVLPVAPTIAAEVDLCLDHGVHMLRARLNVSLPGVARDVARALVDAAHRTCAYSNATRGNIALVASLV